MHLFRIALKAIKRQLNKSIFSSIKRIEDNKLFLKSIIQFSNVLFKAIE